MDTQLLTIKQAAELLGLGYLQTRIHLGDPIDYDMSDNGRRRLLYSIDRVMEVKKRRDALKAERALNKGTQKCYQCGTRVPSSDITSGICSKCQAFKIVKNFACHGDYIHGDIDIARLDRVVDAVNALRMLLIVDVQQPPQNPPVGNC